MKIYVLKARYAHFEEKCSVSWRVSKIFRSAIFICHVCVVVSDGASDAAMLNGPLHVLPTHTIKCFRW